jgi:hypothetical protein
VPLGTLINSAGLLLDIVGALILWKYGLPADVNRAGASALLLESVDDEEIARGKRYDQLSRVGLALLVLGFALQLVSNHVGG